MVDREISLEIDSRQDQVGLVATSVKAIAELAGCDKQVSEQFDLCVTEAVTNCIKHAYQNKPDKPIRTQVSYTDAEIRVKVCHMGDQAQFQILQQLINDISFENQQEFDDFMIDSLMNENGRGLALIRFYTDDCKLEESEGWLCLNMVKNLS